MINLNLQDVSILTIIASNRKLLLKDKALHSKVISSIKTIRCKNIALSILNTKRKIHRHIADIIITWARTN